MAQHQKIQSFPVTERTEKNFKVNERDRDTFKLMVSQWLGTKEAQENFNTCLRSGCPMNRLIFRIRI
jgi:hypothetical protein